MNPVLSKLNPNLESLPVYLPGKPIEEVARELGIPAGDIIKLASNENPLGPSPKALAAMRRVLDHLHLYPDGSAFFLKQKLARKLGVAPSNLVLGNGSNEIIELIGHAFVRPGSEVVVSQYCFAIYPIVTQMFGGKVVTVPALNYGHDLDAMASAITNKTVAVFVANPNNPTGTLASSASLLRFIRGVPKDVLVVLDEAYLEFLDDPLDSVKLVLSGEQQNLVLMRTFSKIFGLAGLRLGYGIAAPELISAFEKIRQPFNINSIAQAGASAALEDSDHIEATRENNRRGLAKYEQACRDLGLEFVPSAANFILIRVGEGQKVFVDLQKKGVIARPMQGYGLPEWIRVSVGTDAENERCIRALASVLGKAYNG
jgi:histidinol-phosphate aminotransferase